MTYEYFIGDKNIKDLSPKEFEEFKRDITNKMLSVIGLKLKDSNDSNKGK